MEWINQLIQKLFCWIPRLELIEPNQRGVRTTLGKHIKVLEPGWYFMVPLIQEIEYAVVVEQVVDTRAQSVMSQEDTSYCVGAGIKYEICDIQKALLCVENFDDSLETLAVGILTPYINSLNDVEIESKKLTKHLKAGLRKETKRWGITILGVYITDLCNVFNLRQL